MKKNIQRVVTFIMALMLVFNIYVPKSNAFAAEAATVAVGTEILKWLGITVAGSAVAWGTNEALNAMFGDTVPSNQPTQSYYTGAVNPISRPTIYNPQEYNTTNTTNTTNNTKIVNTYNKTITTINHTTNNYEIKNYENIYYNNEYNMYTTQIDNYNYYITYAPTYTNITYIDSHATSAGEAYSYNLYYQLPDGRNSYDLKASDVWGTVFLNDFVNYNQVPEDDGQTIALYHFDGDIRDASSVQGTAAYTSGASSTYVDSGAFNKAIYWNNGEHKLKVNIPSVIGTGDYTIAYRMYTARNTMPNLKLMYDWTGSNRQLYYYDVTDMWKNGIFEKAQYSATTGAPTFGKPGGANWFDTTYPDLKSVITMSTMNLANIVKANNSAAILLTHAYKADVSRVTLSSTNQGKYEWQIQGSITKGIYNKIENLQVFQQVSNGEWINIAIVRHNGVKKVYINGLATAGTTDTENIGNNISVEVPNAYFDYSYIDELRITKTALYTDTYTPTSMPYDTNLVLVLPQTGVEDRIAIKSADAVTNTRIGGVRPTYPSKGNVFITLDAANKVETIQQYNGSDWVNTDGAIYKNGIWNSLDKYDMSSYIINEDDFPDYNDANIIGKNNIVYMLSNLSINSGVSTIADGETFHVTLSPDTGYTLPDTVQVVMDMQELAAGTGYTYANGEITVPNVTGDLYISAAGQSDGTGTYNVSYALTNMMLSNQQHTETGITATFQVAEKFDMPTSIKVMMGETELSPITGYTFTGGVLTVPSVTDSVLVVAAAKVNENAVTPTPTPTTTPPPGSGSGTDFTGIIDFFTGLLSSIVNGISSLLSSITTILNSLTGIGTGFVSFLSRSFSFIPAEIVSIYALGVGVMIILAIIKMLRG